VTQHVSRRRTRGWLLPVALVGLMVLLLAVVPTMQTGSQHGGADVPPDADGRPPVDGETIPQEVWPSAPSEPVAQDPPAHEEGAPLPDMADVERRDPGELLAAGPVDAPVALVVFSDYQCPFCAQWSQDTLPVMLEHAEAGHLRIEWRDLNIYGTESERAAQATYAAALQDSFWEYHHALFPDGQIRSHRQLDDEGLIGLAAELGLDTEQFEADLHHPDTIDQIQRNARSGFESGALSTPSFVLGGEPIVGAQPTEVFTRALGAALARSEA